ncbi:MAG: YraN family protein [Leptospira sp.]|nr:YraN family protein [Leptospira sp.]
MEENGYSIIKRNFRLKLGELDIIAKKETILYGIEVKYRKNIDDDFHPLRGMTQHKFRKMKSAMNAFLSSNSEFASHSISFCLLTVDQKGKVDFYSELSN